MSVHVVRAFIKQRELIAGQAEILKKLSKIDATLLKHDEALRIIWQEPTSPHFSHKEGRYSDSPRPWKVNEKRPAWTHWPFHGQRRTDSAAPCA
jgi:hypothetical protein